MYTFGTTISLGSVFRLDLAGGATANRQDLETATSGNIDPFSLPESVAFSMAISFGKSF